ncbi:MAG: hypothetical protein JWO90_2990, partial [Solirubrobacterales bacterium]|nr:hypothetical protein [Solirubrobacterales bacterium]
MDRRRFLSASAAGAGSLFCSLQNVESATRADV